MRDLATKLQGMRLEGKAQQQQAFVFVLLPIKFSLSTESASRIGYSTQPGKCPIDRCLTRPLLVTRWRSITCPGKVCATRDGKKILLTRRLLSRLQARKSPRIAGHGVGVSFTNLEMGGVTGFRHLCGASSGPLGDQMGEGIPITPSKEDLASCCTY